LSKKLIKLTYTRPDTDTLWWWEAVETADPVIKETYIETMKIENQHPRIIDIENSKGLTVFVYWDLPIPEEEPKYLFDWFVLQLVRPEVDDVKSYLTYSKWLNNYKHMNNILVSNIEIVDSDQVAIWQHHA